MYRQSKIFVNSLPFNPKDLIFTVSDYYGVVRDQRGLAGIHNLHYEILINKLKDEKLTIFIIDKGFDSVIFPYHSPVNEELIKSGFFDKIYDNGELVISRRKLKDL